MRQREIRQMNGEDTETHRRRPCEDRGRGGVMLSQAKECWQLQKLKEVSSDSLSEPSEGEPVPATTLILDFWPPELREYKVLSCCCFFKKYLFIYLAVQGFSCGMQDLFKLQHANSWLWHDEPGSLTRDLNAGPLHWECLVLATGPPGKSQPYCFKPPSL